jgi:hypothetical protein
MLRRYVWSREFLLVLANGAVSYATNNRYISLYELALL